MIVKGPADYSRKRLIENIEMLMQVLSALLNRNLMKNELSSNRDKTIQMD